MCWKKKRIILKEEKDALRSENIKYFGTKFEFYN